jgi:hypothetical protein
MRAAAAAEVGSPPRTLDPPTARAGMTGPAHSVRQEADDVSHIIQFETLRKEICTEIRRGTVTQQSLSSPAAKKSQKSNLANSHRHFLGAFLGA